MKWVWWMVVSSLLHAQDAAYQAGLNMAPSLDVRGINTKQVPGQHASHHEDVEGYIRQQQKQRFVIHETDPLWINAEAAVADPDKTMENFVVQGVSSKGRDSLMTCEQGGSEYIQRCEKHLEVEIEVRPTTYRIENYCPGHDDSNGSRDCYGKQGISYRPDYVDRYASPFLVYVHDRHDSHQGNRTTYCYPGCRSRTVIDQPKSVIVTREEWVDGCHTLESLADQGLCQCVDLEIGSKETRIINNEPIARDKWFEKYTYKCLKAAANNCGTLAAKGCVQVASRCKEQIGNVCVLYEQTYTCTRGRKKGTSYKATGKSTPFCLTGDCINDAYDDNEELFEVMSHLAVLQQAQKDIRSHLPIFGGQVRACRKHAIGFSDCCTTGGGNPPLGESSTRHGWGQSLGLMGCNVEEKELAEWRPQRRCVLVGTYCAEREKLTKICLRKKTSFCCFGNKLSRLIQEQGRAQLNMSWGYPKEPDCRGLSPEELSRLDFSRMDLSELFADISQGFHPPSMSHIAEGVELDRIRAHMKVMTHNLQVKGGGS